MAAKAFFLPFRPAIDANGIIVPGAQLFFYATGTTTTQPIYADSALTTQLANPLSANSAGVWPTIYINDTLTYRVVLKTSAGVTLNDQDPYVPGNMGVVNLTGSDLSGTSGASLIGTAAGNTVQQALTATNPFLVPSPSYNPATFNSYRVVNLNNTDYGALFRAQQGPGFNATDAFTVAFTVPSTAAIHMVNGIHVEGVTQRGAVGFSGDVAIYSAMTSKANGGNAFALNLVLNDTAGFTGQTIQNEFDFNVYAADTSVVGLDFIMNTALTGTRGNAIMARSFNVGRWTTVLFSVAGAADIVVYGGPQKTGNSQPSQKLQFNSTSSAGVSMDSIVQADATGQLNVMPAANPTTSASSFCIQNLSAANVTTKTILHQFWGTDTIGVQKAAGSLVVVPGDVNYSAANMVVNVRSADAVVEAVTFVPGGVKFPAFVWGSTLPGASAALKGMVAYVTGVATPTFRSVLAPGTDDAFARCTGTNWIAIG